MEAVIQRHLESTEWELDELQYDLDKAREKKDWPLVEQIANMMTGILHDREFLRCGLIPPYWKVA